MHNRQSLSSHFLFATNAPRTSASLFLVPEIDPLAYKKDSQSKDVPTFSEKMEAQTEQVAKSLDKGAARRE